MNEQQRLIFVLEELNEKLGFLVRDRQDLWSYLRDLTNEINVFRKQQTALFVMENVKCTCGHSHVIGE